ncbi:hypothetical protein AgCh_003694 [Apium graveolens]
MRGTSGYLAPEWISGVAVTAKADVYSYGMMAFEFISGRQNTEQNADGSITFFPSWAARDDESVRPSMSQIVQILEGVSDVILPPYPKNLQVFADNQKVVFSTGSSSSQTSQTKSMPSTSSSQSKSISAESSNI